MSRGALNFSQKNEWYTPKYIVDKFGPFDYDPATTEEKAREFGVKAFDTIETDGLKADWTKYESIWINPPFTKKKEFLRKAVETFIETGAYICFLCPINYITTKDFHNAIDEVGCDFYIPKGRIKFETDGESVSPPFGSVIVHLGGHSEWEPIDI